MIRFGLSTAPPLPPSPRLAFVESGWDVQQAILLVNRGAIDGFVALHPDAGWALCQTRRSYLKLEQTYSEVKDICPLADQALQEQFAWASWVDDELQREVPEFGASHFQPARMYLYHLKLVFDSLRIRSFILAKALQTWKPRQVWHAEPDKTNEQFGFNLEFFGSIWPEIFPLVVSKHNISYETWPSNFMPAAVDRKRLILALYEWLKSWARKRVASMPREGEKNILILDHTYDMEYIWRLAKRRHLSVFKWEKVVDQLRAEVKSSEAVVWQMKEHWKRFSIEPRFRVMVQQDGYDFWKIVESRLCYWWEHIIPEQWGIFQRTRQRYEMQKPKATVLPILRNHYERGVFAGLRSLGTSTVIHQHGGYVGTCECPSVDSNELWQADFDLTYGEGVTEYLEERRSKNKQIFARPISVGSARLDVLRAGLPTPRKTFTRPQVLLVPNTILDPNRYLDCGAVPEMTESEIQAEMVHIAHDFPHYRFIYKPFYDQRATPAVALASEKGSNCQVDTKTSLTRLLAKADLIILDFPSTALLEALATRQPIIVLVDSNCIKMFPQAMQRLQGRAIVSETPENFVRDIRSFLARGSIQPLTNPDDSFLQAYGTHLGDGKSAERVLNWLMLDACNKEAKHL